MFTAAIMNGKPQEDMFSIIPPVAAFPWLNFADSTALTMPPYSCRLCMSQFPSVISLQKHFTTAHYLNSVLNNNIQNNNNNDNNANNNNACKTGIGAMPPFNWPLLTNGYHHSTLGDGVGGVFLPDDAVQTGPTDLSVSSSSKHGSSGGKHHSSSSGKHKSADDPRNHANSKKSRSSPSREHAVQQHPADQRSIKLERGVYDAKLHQQLHHQLPQPTSRSSVIPGGNKIQLPCPHCQLTFTHFEDYQQHVIGHFLTAAAEYACQECSTSFTTSEHVQKHLMETHAQNFYRCMLCKEVFPTKSALKIHFSMNHGSEHRMFRCNNCTGVSRPLFQTEIEFIDHLRNTHYSARSPPPTQTNLVSLLYATRI